MPNPNVEEMLSDAITSITIAAAVSATQFSHSLVSPLIAAILDESMPFEWHEIVEMARESREKLVSFERALKEQRGLPESRTTEVH